MHGGLKATAFISTTNFLANPEVFVVYDCLVFFYLPWKLTLFWYIFVIINTRAITYYWVGYSEYFRLQQNDPYVKYSRYFRVQYNKKSDTTFLKIWYLTKFF